MKITFLGGADEVGGSAVLIEIAGRRVLVDAGIRPSPKARWGLAGDQLPHLDLIEQSGGIDAVLVTHAHTDHTGALELVAGRYPGIPFYATPMTIALVQVLHRDARRIMQSRLDEEGELPLFDDLAVQRLLEAFQPAPFNSRIPLGDGLVASFYPAGHIAGAAMVGLQSDDGRVLISGDVAVSPQRTVEGAKAPPFRPDVLILESTYGGRLHANRAVQERLLVQTVREVVEGGGKVLIPAFALGRAQELMLILSEFRQRGELPPVPVWADGMVRAVCQAYSGFGESLPLAFQERGGQFFDAHTHAVQTNAERNALIWQPDPAVIISSSGMLAGGPSQSYARALAGQPQHAILLTGYQDEESPGRRLQELAQRGRGSLVLGKERVEVQCRLGSYSLSAHADEGQLVSLAETLDAPDIALVHGDEAARASLAQALGARQRSVHLPQAGRTLEFKFKRPFRAARPRPARADGPPDIPQLWREVAAPLGGLFLLEELGQEWWGQPDAGRLAELAGALAEDGLHFLEYPQRPGMYRARSGQELELAQRRRTQLAGLGVGPGCWLALRRLNDAPWLVRCARLAQDHLLVETEEGLEQAAWPEEVLEVYGEQRPEPGSLERAGAALQVRAQGWMEPNQAMAFAWQHFPPEARLRKVGYRLEARQLVLTFDFPDVAREQFGERLEALPPATGWEVEVAPEANQAALFSLVQDLLPAGWRVVKGPALHREQKRVAVGVSHPRGEPAGVALERMCAAYRQVSGLELSANVEAAANTPASLPAEMPDGERMEINAAYAVIKAALAGQPLYRVSLKGEQIVLTFISPQVGERFRSELNGLSRQTGWPLGLNPQPNQGAILEAVQVTLKQAGARVLKGPSLYLERGEVGVSLAADPGAEALQRVVEAVQEQTGYRLAATFPQAVAPAAGLPAAAPGGGQPAVEIALARIRLSCYQQGLSLDPQKLAAAVNKLQRDGLVSSPVKLRRLPDGYLLLDGLYRLRAAQELGMEKIWAIVE